MPIEIKYAPFKQQADLHEAFSEYKIRCAVTGSRGGKTTAGWYDTLDKAISQPNHHEEDIRRGDPYVICIATKGHSTVHDVIRRPFARFIPPELVIEGYHGQRRNIIMRGRHGPTEIYFFSSTFPETWQGRRWNGCWIDEAPLSPERAFDEAQVRLTDRNGWMLLTGTPRGPNWVLRRIYLPWKECQALREKGEPVSGHEGEQIYFTTWRSIDNQYVPRELIESKRSTMSKREFRRQYEAAWDTFEGQIYEEFDHFKHVKSASQFEFLLPSGRRTVAPGYHTGKERQRARLGQVIAGIDWGYGQGHAGAIVIVGILRNGKMIVLEDFCSEGILISSNSPGVDSWIKRAKGFMAKWEIETFYCDSASPGNVAQFKQAGLPVTIAMKEVTEGVQAVGSYLHPDPSNDNRAKLFFLNTCEETINEIQYYHWQEGGKEIPAKIDDHCMDALRYAIYTYFKRGTFRREPGYVAAWK